jgi:hypothetical protein
LWLRVKDMPRRFNYHLATAFIVLLAINLSLAKFPNNLKNWNNPFESLALSGPPAAISTLSTVVFTETMGTPSGTTLIPAYETANGFDNDGYTMSGSADVRTTTPSTGYAGASGLGNVFITNAAGKNFIISGINTSGLTNLQLSFGINKSSLTGDGSDLLVQVSTNGTAYTNLSFAALPTGSGTAGSVWNYRTISTGIPASSTLSIQFKQNGTATQYRIDDIKLVSVTQPTITASGPTTFCNGGSVTLTASAGTSYLWSNGATTQSITVTNAGSYTVTVDAVASAATVVTVNNCFNTLNLKAFIQGFYLGGGLQQAVLDPVASPTICDSITVELHSSTSPYALLYATKNVLATNGTGSFQFPAATLGNSYYVVIHHRNSIETWSKLPITFFSSAVSLDLTVPDNSVPNNPVPVITSINPTSAIAGGSSFTLTVSGANFISGSIIKWNGTNLATTYVNATQLTAVVPSANISASGTATVTVFNATPGGGTSNSLSFTISAANNPVPVITSINPTSAIAGGSSFILTVSGTNFISGSIIKWNGTNLATTYVNATQLTAVVPSANISASGTATVTVFNATPGGGTSNSLSFTISAANNPVPVITSINPTSAIAGGSSFILTVSGTNFISGSIIKWNGTNLTTTYVNATQLTAVVPSANITASGTATVTVFNATPGGGTSNGLTFTINAAVPTAKKFLFDATKAETSGNADWVIDQDASVPRFPTPAQSNVTSTTSETFWTGALSSWGIALVKKGHTVESLPSSGSITYGNANNAQDLSNYDVFVVDEPNILFTAAEKTAIIQFVNNGGGLMMIADHTISDRNNDGWDSPDIWNDLMTNNSIQNNPFGFSIDLTNISEVSSNILATWTTNPILNGSEGAVTQLEFNNGATITTNTTANTNVKGLIWQTGFSQTSTHAMCATSTYGTGRVFVVTDSSPMDDGTGNPADNLFPGWTSFSHSKLFMNASLWLSKLQ